MWRSCYRVPPKGKEAHENTTRCPHQRELALCDPWLFPKVKVAMTGKRSGSTQDIRAAATVQVDTAERGLPELLRKRQGGWEQHPVTKSRGKVLKGIHGSESFTVMHILKYVNTHRSFRSCLYTENILAPILRAAPDPHEHTLLS